ncbi:tRNA lysidine(34) synthetase TilS [Rhodosalinus sp.]|uniref:tRNA lysidine(34) synthetase TilS n=1 Tax=Rhodosalinus sp. TaxID=2047741 RepID=UPI00397C6437
MTLDRRVSAELDRLLPQTPARLGVAVSGGGDSMALLHLARAWARSRDIALHAVTVDHGLRPEAAAEAGFVAAAAAALDVPHTILRWQGWDGRGNLQDAARQARRRLIARWAAGQGIAAVAQGHTLDDQAETVLLRLARGSGVDGLAGMAAVTRTAGVTWLRPLLGERRAELRQWLAASGLSWVEDPSNDDSRFARVRARGLLAELAPLGLDAPRLGRTARAMRRAREVLDNAAVDLAARAAEVTAGAVAIDRTPLAAAPEDTRLRLVAGAIALIGGRPYRPRLDALEGVVATGEGTLAGCRLVTEANRLWIAREAAAAADGSRPGDVWDRRWRVTGPEPGRRIAALGSAGLLQCAGWRAAGLPQAVLEGSPAVWDGPELIAAPVAGKPAGWHAAPLIGARDLAAQFAAH